MNSHITNTKPTCIQRLLYMLGIIDLPTKVNCWFCNQDSYILPGTKNTSTHWYCHLCENTNARDENGDIIDPSPLHVPSNGIPTTNNYHASSTKGRNSRSICNDCQRNQLLIYNMMSDYIPDETDPNYEELCNNAENENKRLHSEYSLCDPCQELVNQVVKEQLGELYIRKLTEFSRAKIPGPKRPRRAVYYMKGVIWYLVQVFVLIFVVYCTFFPPNGNLVDWMNLNTNILDVKDYIILSHKYGFNFYEISEYLINSATNTRNSYKQLVKCSINGYCLWDMNDYIASLLFFNLISYSTIDWHPYVELLHNEKVKHWDKYKLFQTVLFVIRTTMIFLAVLDNSMQLLWSFTIVYFTILIISVVSLKLPIHYGLKKTTTKINNDDKEEQDKDITMAEAGPSISNNDDSIDNISEGINRIRFL